MSKKLASLLVKIGANGAEVEKEFRTIEKNAQKLSKTLSDYGKKLSLSVTAPIIAMGAAAVKAADTQMQAEERLRTALKGREDVYKALTEQAAELQSRSTMGDETIIAQQAYLASLGMTEQQIKSTTEAAVQLSYATGMSLDSAVKNLAKTFGGLTGELGESIPALKELTVEQLKSGEAVHFILQNYKGFAEATAEAGLSVKDQLLNELSDLGEMLGEIIIPVLKDLVEWLRGVVANLRELSPEMQKVVVVVAGLAAAIGPVLTIGSKVAALFGKLVSLVKAVAPAVGGAVVALKGAGASLLAMATPLGVVLGGVTALASAFVVLRKNAKEASKEVYNSALKAGREENKKYFYDLATKMYSDKSVAEIEAEIKRLRDENAETLALKNSQGGNLTEAQVASLVNVTAQIQALKDILVRRKEESEAVKEVTKEIKAQTQAVKDYKVEVEKPINKRDTVDVVNPFGVAKTMNQLASEDLAKHIEGANILGSLRRQWEAWEDEARGISQIASSVSAILSNAMADVVSAIGEGLGNLLTGNELTPMQTFLELLGTTLKKLGSALITYATTMQVFKESLKTIFATPWVAIGAGIAAIAAGTAFTNMAKEPIKLANGGLAYGPTMAVVGDNINAASDPEVIAPLSKLRGMGVGGALQLAGEIELRVRGNDLYAVLNRENFRRTRLG